MSKYANYSTASGDYDKTRISVGVETILACFRQTDVPLGEQAVLEAGCGTGNYLEALRGHVGSLHGVDFNEGMLAQARSKVGEDVELSCGSVTALSFEDGSFDGVTCNQVIHHLEEGPSAVDDPAEWQPCTFSNLTRFIEEAYRVLRPGGALVLNVTTLDQFRDGYWWADLVPDAVERLSCRMPSIVQLQEIMTGAGFESELVSADLLGILQGASYLNPDGPLSETWRAGDSTWSLVSDTELANAQQRVERMNVDGTMQAYLDEREEKRASTGQSTFVCGRK